jgi:hypothetical protein
MRTCRLVSCSLARKCYIPTFSMIHVSLLLSRTREIANCNSVCFDPSQRLRQTKPSSWSLLVGLSYLIPVSESLLELGTVFLRMC